jgi:hypothetical protein
VAFPTQLGVALNKSGSLRGGEADAAIQCCFFFDWIATPLRGSR